MNEIKNIIGSVGLCSMVLFGSIIMKNDLSAQYGIEKPIDQKNMDKSIKPGADFFLYGNGTWMKNNPIPSDKSRFGAFEVLDKINSERIKEVCETAAENTKAEKGSNLQKVGDFFYSGMDEKNIEALGAKPLDGFFNKINAINDLKTMQEYVEFMHSNGDNVLFTTGAEPDMKNSQMNIGSLYQTGLGMSDKDYYFPKNAKDKERIAKYTEYVTKIFTLIGDKNPKESAKTLIKFETSLAKISMSRLDMRDPLKLYNKTDIVGVKKTVPNWDWEKYFKTIGMKQTTEINIGTKAYFVGLNKLLKSEKIETFKLYFKYFIANDLANYLSNDFVNAKFDFQGKYMSGKAELEPRWKRIVGATNGVLGEALGQVYVEKYFPVAAKTKMEALVNNLKEALKVSINELDWMEAKTKVNAQAKLSTIMVKIGYPNKWKDYSKLTIKRDDLVGNLMAASKFIFDDQISRVGKKVDREEWHMTPQTVNAYYNPLNNEIVFPAAILQPPFFYLDGDDAVNYGAIGAVIGHEITHGFDDEGRKFDKDGNLTDWWTETDIKNYEVKTQKIVEQYNVFDAMEGSKVNGKLTLGENIADLGGVTIAYSAMKMANKGKEPAPIETLTQDQRFFLTYAGVWRQNIKKEELVRRLVEDVHSPGNARVNVVVSNMPQFYKAFDIKQGDKLWRDEKSRAKVW